MTLAARFANILSLKQLMKVTNISAYVHQATGNTMLLIAAMNGNIENVKFLIQSGLDPLKRNN
jgi:hypothetical protein